MPYPNTHTTLLAAAEVTLVSSVEQDGRTAACPGELVTFTCTVTQGVSLNWASTAFTSCDSTPTYTLEVNTSVGRTSVCGSFLANLTSITNINRVGQSLTANLTSTLSLTTSVSPGTVITCSDLLIPQRSPQSKQYPNAASKPACHNWILVYVYIVCVYSLPFFCTCAFRFAVSSSEPCHHCSLWYSEHYCCSPVELPPEWWRCSCWQLYCHSGGSWSSSSLHHHQCPASGHLYPGQQWGVHCQHCSHQLCRNWRNSFTKHLTVRRWTYSLWITCSYQYMNW